MNPLASFIFGVVDVLNYVSGITEDDYAAYDRENNPNPEQLAQDHAEDVENYVRCIASCGTMRTSSVDTENNILYWEEYVMDQDGNRHIVSSGSHYCGSNGYDGHDSLDVIDGQIVHEIPDNKPVYMRLQG